MPNPFADAKSARQPHGHFIVDGKLVADTLQCCHCNQHFVLVKGSSRLRGFCRNCHQVTCGASSCNVCVPFEKKLEAHEKRARTIIFDHLGHPTTY